MKTHLLPLSTAIVVALALNLAACGRQTRGNSDAGAQSRAASPAEGGATSTAGSAGQSKNFGDTRAKTQQDGQSPSASPTGLSQDAKSTDMTPRENPSATQRTDAPAGAK